MSVPQPQSNCGWNAVGVPLRPTGWQFLRLVLSGAEVLQPWQLVRQLGGFVDQYR
jgi:hypothetical protein